MKRRFRVAFSFAGEKRDYVARIAAVLADLLGRSAILYDQYHEAEFARSDLGFYLPRLYHRQFDLIVVVLCPDYAANEWCGLEWNAIFDLVKSHRNAEVMLLRFGRALVQGLYSTAGFVEFDEKTPEQTATLILQRLVRNDGKATDEFDPMVPSDHGFARTFRRTTKAFLDEYLVSETGEVPFGGRDGELRRLDAWLFDPKAASRMLVTAPAGRGKSALLVHWMKSLRDRPQFAREGWQLAFVPISIRVGTNLPTTFYGGLVQRLAEITGESIASEAIQNAEALKAFIQDRLEAAASAGRRLLVVLDDLDEALQGSFDPSIMPRWLPTNLRIVASARWQVGDTDSTGWLRKLGWDRNVRAEQLELERLPRDAIAEVLLKLGAPTDVLAREREIVDRLCKLTEGEPDASDRGKDKRAAPLRSNCLRLEGITANSIPRSLHVARKSSENAFELLPRAAPAVLDELHPFLRRQSDILKMPLQELKGVRRRVFWGYLIAVQLSKVLLPPCGKSSPQNRRAPAKAFALQILGDFRVRKDVSGASPPLPPAP
jgi:hypothetical protein